MTDSSTDTEEERGATRAASGTTPLAAVGMEELVSLCLGGDEEAWRELVARHARLVMAVASRSGLDEDAAGDVFQDVWTLLAERLGLVRDPESLPKWLIVTTRRLARRRRHGLRRTLTMGDHDPEIAAEAGSESSGPTPPDEAFIEDERRLAVELAVAELPERDRSLLVDLFVHELPYKEIAERHGLAIGSLGSLRRRALDSLQRALRKRGVA